MTGVWKFSSALDLLLFCFWFMIGVSKGGERQTKEQELKKDFVLSNNYQSKLIHQLKVMSFQLQ